VQQVAQQHVRVCPVCETENPPERARCVCGASLAGVDFALKRPPADPSAETVEVERIAPASASPDGVPTSTATNACPHADCGQPNAPGALRCIYCNRPMHADAAPTAVAGARPLPSALRDDYRVVDVFPASGSEADILLVAHVPSGEKRVVKLYRKGVAPDFRLLSILSQSIGDTVVKVLAHGTSDGVAYELLEYIPGGTLQQWMQQGPLPRADVQRIVTEIADALNGIHAHRILHRDLKPENVLVRQTQPLELALTDFGIASLSEATQHFTGGARTTRYAAPEALTGVLDVKSDWWSLGMIALEAATGRHPFEGLTEQVMNHHLATRPIDVRAVYDDRLRQLCRGLLLRDPKKRWGSAEVARWLDGDATLDVADDADGTALSVRPYRIGTTECTTAAELALALARHWDEARKDLARGQIARWVEQELHDYNLVRKLRDVEDHRDLSADARLLRFIVAAAPDLPPVWRGAPLGHDALLDAARRATADDDAAADWLDSLYRDGVLAQYSAAGRETLREIDRYWRDGWALFLDLWQRARAAEEKWRAEPRAIAGAPGAAVVSFDDLAFQPTGRLAPPPQRAANGAIIVACNDAGYVEALRGEVLGRLASIAGYCPWFESLWDSAQRTPIGVVVAHRLLLFADDDARIEARRQSATDSARADIVARAREELRSRLAHVVDIAPDDNADPDTEAMAQMQAALDPLQQACQQTIALPYADADCEALRRHADKFATMGMAVQRALAGAQEAKGVNAIFLRPDRLAIGGAVVFGSLVFRMPWVTAFLLVAAAIVAGWRWYAGFRATEAVLAKFRLLRVHAKSFLRAPAAGGDTHGAR